MRNGLTSRGRKVLKAREVLLGQEAVEVPVGTLDVRLASAPVPEGEPEIEVERAEDGTVRAIQVRCPCGRVTTLQCEYSEQGGENESKDS
ncbi:MAG: hypothetical protein KAX44_00900 [Candidatus Brocadiae bacterium]|nr:hypothetical protein [Candidatus Brocadiia bacterium]